MLCSTFMAAEGSPAIKIKVGVWVGVNIKVRVRVRVPVQGKDEYWGYTCS